MIDIKGKDYHIEGNGKVCIVKKPKIESMPIDYPTKLEIDSSLPTVVLQVGEINKMIKKKKGLVKDESVGTIANKLQ